MAMAKKYEPEKWAALMITRWAKKVLEKRKKEREEAKCNNVE